MMMISMSLENARILVHYKKEEETLFIKLPKTIGRFLMKEVHCGAYFTLDFACLLRLPGILGWYIRGVNYYINILY